MRRFVLALCCVVGTSVDTARADGPYDDLLKYVPGTTNALALIDIKGAFASPLAKGESWGEKGQHNNRAGLGFLSPGAESVVIAAEVNLNTMARTFQVGLVKYRNAPSVKEMGDREGGSFDQIADLPTVLSPRDVYFTNLSASVVAAVYPADRQNTARWIRAAVASKSSPLTGYLKQAAEKAGGNTVTIALDLEDVVDKNLLRLSLPSSPTVVKSKTVDVGLLAGFLATVKGMTFSAKIDQSIAGSMTWDFALDPSQYRKILPALVQEMIDGQGITVPSMETWEPSFSGTTMTLSGPLTSLELKRLVSLFSFPSVAEEASDVEAKGAPVSVAATKRYVSTVSSILDELNKVVDSPYYKKSATWHDKAAAQILQLSRQRVDPAAIDASVQIAKRLQAIAASLRGVPIDVEALASQQYYYSYMPRGVWAMPMGWWGWRPSISVGPTQVDTNAPQVQAAISKVIADDQQRRADAWSFINRTRVETRRMLSEKYKTAF